LNRNIAIDGPAGSGKSTIAKLIGKKLDLMYINTGAMYRAVTLEALNKGIEAEDTEKLSDIINSMEMYFKNDDLYVNNENVSSAITTPHISNNVSKYAAVPLVRKKLVLKMQKMAEEFDVIMDGRDIGTVVLKDASYKFFLIASPEERANRRFKEYKEKNIEIDYNELLDDIKRRDYLDSTRAMDPLRKAEDAFEIDSTHLTIDGVVEEILCYIKAYSNK
jgi:CMP/dCMP kinase